MRITHILISVVGVSDTICIMQPSRILYEGRVLIADTNDAAETFCNGQPFVYKKVPVLGHEHFTVIYRNHVREVYL